MPTDARPTPTFVTFENTAIEQSIVARFEQQVAQYPDRVAVVSAGLRFTYTQLNHVANRIARAVLSRLGAGEEPVGLLLDHGVLLIAAILGVLKAGKIYISLDLPDPEPRMASMLEDSQAKLLLTSTKHLSLARQLVKGDRQILNCDDVDNDIAAGNLNLAISPGASALMLYTSGTTGRPKGVVHSHRNILVETRNYTNYARICREDRLTLWHSCSYANSIRNLYSALLNGAALFTYDLAAERFPGLAEWLRTHRISILNTLPTTFRCFCQTLAPDAVFPEVRILRVGGESINRDDIKRYQRHFSPHCLLMHGLGPTETLDILHYSITHDWQSSEVKIPIGYAVPDKEVVLLNEAGEEVGADQIGEIAVRSKHLALGYWGQPELTQSAFVPDPHGGDERLYRTGDLGVMRPDGCLTHLGRKDFQVKIRGYRVEVTAIEEALLNINSIEAAVVQAQADDASEQRLVAYVVPVAGTEPTVNELRRGLAQTLPDYMMPSAFVFLETIPLSTTGKIDRRALPSPDGARPRLEQAFVAPRSPTEEAVAKTWGKLLNLKQVGIHDNFFDLGGHSLLATQIISRLRDIFEIEVPLHRLFEAPTVAALAEHIDGARRAGHGPTVEPPKPVARDHNLPLSFAQERLWFLDQLEPCNSAYNIPLAVRLTGRLVVVALEQSLNEILRRHEALRTTFMVADGRPVQVIAPALVLTLAVEDLQELSEIEQAAEAQHLADEEAQRLFDLACGPLVRASLLRLGEEEHVLLLTLHHIVADGWSTEILFRELSILYEAFSTGKPSALPDLPIQYADFAVWQRQWLQGENLESRLSYWKSQLDGISTLQLPTDRPRPAVQSSRGGCQSLVLQKTLTRRLKDMSRTDGVTLFMTLLAAFQTLLHRYTGQDDIAVGSPIAGRTRSETEGLIGFFVNALVLRVDLSGDPTFREVLRRVRNVALGAYAQQDLPFEKLVEVLQPARDLSRSPLFQVLFNMPDVSNRRMDVAGLKVEILSSPPALSKYDLTLYAIEQNGSIRLQLVYNTDLFAEARIVAMLSQLEHLLSQILQSPEEKISRFSLVTNASAAVLPNPAAALDATWYGAIHNLFSKQASRFPDRLAVVDPHESWSYAELETRSNQLANYLRANGIQSQDIVAVYGDRSASLVWVLLGILKAGSAFLILDPAYPASRLIDYLIVAQPRGWIQLEEAGVVPETLEHFLTASSKCCRLKLSRCSAVVGEDPLAAHSIENPGVTGGPDELAYVAFTSGSTGKPRGILGRHGPVSHFLPSLKQTFNFNETDRFSVVSGLSFNPLHREIFTPLWLGATLCIPDPADIAPGRLAEWMKRSQISVAHLTPAMSQILTQAKHGTILISLRYAFFAGDVLRKRDVSELRKLAPQVRVVNFYGATETQRAVGHFVVPDEQDTISDSDQLDKRSQEIIPLGRGINDVQLLVLNASQNLAGVSEIGEICFRSPHLAKGYMNDDSLTSERFISNPFTKDPSDRLYKTTELGRYLPDGNVEFIGRVDHQVKIRGFRIELGEIETVLSQNPAVQESVVVAQEDVHGDKRLVGYIVPRKEQALTVSKLRGFLKSKLPEHMVPSTFVLLDALPLTPNGKVDRLALPATTGTRPELDKAMVAPRTAVEKTLSQIWSQVLGLKQVGIYDNFFELGGHSLLATRVIFRAREVFKMELPLHVLFEKPTIEELAHVISHGQAMGTEREDLYLLLTELEALSDEEARQLLVDETT
jgi:amino acid adenylation domain-containing protein